MEREVQDIQAPLTKTVTALAASGGSAIIAQAQVVQSFLPTDAVGWMSLAASGVACAYSLCLWGEWWWKKFLKPFLRKWGWVR